jgi:hypothetical protein
MPLARPWAAVAALALAGCNMAYSPTAMLTAADGGNQPFLKYGLWEWTEPCHERPETTGCRRETKRFVVTAASWEALDDERAGKRDIVPAPAYLAVPGRPLVVQFQVNDSPDNHDDFNYVFLGLAPLKQDRDGKITSAEWWIVQCGPPPEAGPANGAGKDARESEHVTRDPLPGMTIIGADCVPRDRATLLNAAALSRQWATDGVVTMTWLQASAPRTPGRPE